MPLLIFVGPAFLLYVKKNTFTVEKVLGKVNLADLFTKYVGVTTLSNLRPAVMGRVPPPPPGGVEPQPEIAN